MLDSKNRKSKGNKENKENKDLDILLIASVLRRYSNEMEAITVGQIKKALDDLGYKEISERTVSRKMDSILAAQEDAMLGPVLWEMLGGRICDTCAASILSGAYVPRKSNTRNIRYYYFERALTDSQVDMVRAMIYSHPYFSARERLGILEGLGLARKVDRKEKPKTAQGTSKKLPLPGEQDRLLYTIDTLYAAIQEKLQVEFEYGTYDVTSPDREYTVAFRKRTNEDGSVKIYRMNPFGMLWDGGYYYLVAVDDNKENITHFRVDRMVNARIATRKNAKGQELELKRGKAPEALKPYLKNGLFDEDAYRKVHKGMRIYEELKLISFSVECSDWSLQMLVDSFGADVRVLDCKEEVQKSELGTYRNNEKKLRARVHEVEYQTALTFCLGHADYITVLEPQELKDQVKQWLQDIAGRYN